MGAMEKSSGFSWALKNKFLLSEAQLAPYELIQRDQASIPLMLMLLSFNYLFCFVDAILCGHNCQVQLHTFLNGIIQMITASALQGALHFI